jgi:hypothetical protein
MKKIDRGWRSANQNIEHFLREGLENIKIGYNIAKAQNIIKNCDTFKEFSKKSCLDNDTALEMWEEYVSSIN